MVPKVVSQLSYLGGTTVYPFLGERVGTSQMPHPHLVGSIKLALTKKECVETAYQGTVSNRRYSQSQISNLTMQLD